MRIAIERRQPAPSQPQLSEVVTPRTNTAAVSAAENFFSSLAAAVGVSLEMAATHQARWFQVRSANPIVRRQVEEQLQVAYPQARLRPVDTDRHPGADPAGVQVGQQVAACSLTLRAPAYLPLRTFRDQDLAGSQSSEGDPVLGVLAALGTVPEGCRAVSQLVLEPAPRGWTKPFQRLAVEHPLAGERGAAVARPETTSTGVSMLAVVLLVLAMGIPAYRWYAAGEWLNLAKLLAAIVAGLLIIFEVVALWRRLFDKPIYDPEQVREKISRIGFRAELRLAVIGLAESDPGELVTCLERIKAAYGAFGLAFGNELVARRLRLTGHDLRLPHLFGRAKKTPILNTRELAGLWHLPHATADVPLLERTGAKRILPLPERVASGCRIGVSTHQGRSFPVCIPDAVFWRHLALFAKTGRGKSATLVRLALHVLQALFAGGKQAALILVDPHRDLARTLLGLIPPERRPDVVYLDAANEARPFGLNLVDAGLGWNRDQMLTIVLDILRREFSQAWGFRMESAFRYSLLTLFEANQTICARDPLCGRQRQYTILDIPALLSDPPFRRSILRLVGDPEVRDWWPQQFERLHHSFQVEVVFPVQTKIFRFAGIRPAQRIVGQPCSTIDPLHWVTSGSVVIVNTAAGLIGRDGAALIGDLLLNLAGLTLLEQAAVDREERARAMVIVDEMHLMPGAEFELLLAEAAKYGGSLVLATQSLARLDALDREQGRALRSSIFANIDGLLVFNTSAEDARYLEQELGETVTRQDILALGEHECYLRLPNGADGAASLCWVQLDPPPAPDQAVQRELADTSAAAFGRDVKDVERDLLAALARIEQTHTPRGDQGLDGGGGAPRDGGDG
ncbi:MAG: DUF87 domain-containing protein, partial [Chloroflexota bacterium]|nr:DUF87 domain-containing protein [Chloroflexota bacterium]